MGLRCSIGGAVRKKVSEQHASDSLQKSLGSVMDLVCSSLLEFQEGCVKDGIKRTKGPQDTKGDPCKAC